MSANAVPAEASPDYRSIGLVALQLVLVLFVIHTFQIESRTFFHVMVLAAIGFVVHALLPLRRRLAFFTALSLASVLLALGLRDGIAVIGLGVGMIAICHLPFAVSYRVGLLITAGVFFAIWRVGWMPSPWSLAIWPILASMFMFRVIIYLYALSYEKRQPTVFQSLAYFFMLPNVCFPLYPVIDYTTFIRTYYERAAERIYTTGMRWIVRGLIHLILYRFVYLYLVLDPTEVLDLGDLVQFMLATFLLYLRVSGQFHIIAGVLHLYGFHLPETHHLYYLSASFTDFWRRINIYWKDFMMKLVYYPSFFQLRRFGTQAAMVASTVVVFAATWLLHSYQWFWLRGGFPLTAPDALFWAVLGTLVVFGALREMKRSSAKSLRESPSWNFALAARRLGVFATICFLWSMWSSDSITGWLTMLGAAGDISLTDVGFIALLVTAGGLVAGKNWSRRETEDTAVLPFYRRPALQSSALLVLISCIGMPALYGGYAPNVATTIASLQRSTLNATDAALQHKGYYENLDNSSRMSAQLWDIQASKPAHWVPLSETPAYHLRQDFLSADLRPDTRIVFEDRPLTTNSWGMRDRERSLSKPEGTYRIALLGPSHIMGSGVGDEETIAAFLERRLNQSREFAPERNYEVLNFGVAAYSLLQQLARLEDRALSFQPDAVFITDSPGLVPPMLNHLENTVLNNIPIPYPEIQDLVQRAGIESLGNKGYPVPFSSTRRLLGAVGVETRMSGREARRRLTPFSGELVRLTFQRIAEVSRRNGAVPVFVALNVVSDSGPGDLPALSDAKAAGFLVFNLLDVWKDRDKAALRIAAWDEHPNAEGNRVVAERLFELITQNVFELKLPVERTAALSQH